MYLLAESTVAQKRIYRGPSEEEDTRNLVTIHVVRALEEILPVWATHRTDSVNLKYVQFQNFVLE